MSSSQAAFDLTSTPRVELRDVSKFFGPTQVLHSVNVSVSPGEVHGLVGQNGAGKSTLMKILGGVHPDFSGSVLIDGEEVVLPTPRAALHAGIGMIYQELSLVPGLTVAENLMLGVEPGSFVTRGGAIVQAARELTRDIPIMHDIDLTATVADLSAGMRQRLEIAKALTRNARVLVMDEPTARLAAPDRKQLFATIRQLGDLGIAVIYISHFLEEVFDACTSVSVLRNGRKAAHGPIEQFDMGSLTRAMLSAELAAEEHPDLSEVKHGRVILEGTGLATERLQGVDIQVRAGEIVGLAGLVGSGRTRVLRALAGADRLLGGRITVEGKRRKFSSPRAALASSVVMLPEDRKADGVFAELTATKNVSVASLEVGLSRFGIVRPGALREAVTQAMESYAIAPSDPSKSGSDFSGGNQQKLLLARAMLSKPAVLLADQPTAGVDVGAKAQIHDILRNAAERGVGIVFATDDLEELLALSHRVLVMRRGKILADLSRDEVDREQLIEGMSRSVDERALAVSG